MPFSVQIRRNPTTSQVSQWYIVFWSSEICVGQMDVHVALQSCRLMEYVLKSGLPSGTAHLPALQSLCKKMHRHFVDTFYSDVLALNEGKEYALYNKGIPVNISSAISTFNNLARSYNVSNVCPSMVFLWQS